MTAVFPRTRVRGSEPPLLRQGEEQVITDDMYETFLECNRQNSERLPLDADLIMVHDPQPAALVLTRNAVGSWVWRCHIDASRPQRRVWNFLRRCVERYDAAVFSLPKFAQRLSCHRGGGGSVSGNCSL